MWGAGLEVEFFGVGGVGVFGPASLSFGGFDDFAFEGVDGHVRAAGAELFELSCADLGAEFDEVVDVVAGCDLGAVLDGVDGFGIRQRDDDFEFLDFAY